MRAGLVFFGIFLLPLATATHDAGCIPGQAPPSTVTVVHVPGDGTYYLEDRPGTICVPPLCGSGTPVDCLLLSTGGCWTYEETNGVEGLQRGGVGLGGECLPPQPLPCLIIDEDPVTDENCEHGPDKIIF